MIISLGRAVVPRDGYLTGVCGDQGPWAAVLVKGMIGRDGTMTCTGRHTAQTLPNWSSGRGPRVALTGDHGPF
jgi:hypothetical protein